MYIHRWIGRLGCEQMGGQHTHGAAAKVMNSKVRPGTCCWKIKVG